MTDYNGNLILRELFFNDRINKFSVVAGNGEFGLKMHSSRKSLTLVFLSRMMVSLCATRGWFMMWTLSLIHI